MGLPLSSDSSTASSRARSWMARAIRNRYLPRSAPDSADQTPSYARRAARIASSTSAGPASATSASGVSSAGLIVLTGSLPPSRNSPLTKIW